MATFAQFNNEIKLSRSFTKLKKSKQIKNINKANKNRMPIICGTVTRIQKYINKNKIPPPLKNKTKNYDNKKVKVCVK